NTMVKRPIVNTRDEPHADPSKYRRLHVIAGDVNMAECSTYLKVGTLAILLDMVEADWPIPQIEVEDPVQAIKRMSRDREVKAEIAPPGRKTMTAITIR